MDDTLTLATTSKSQYAPRIYNVVPAQADLFGERAEEDCQRKDSASFIFRQFQKAYNAKELVWTSRGWVFRPKKKRGGNGKK